MTIQRLHPRVRPLAIAATLVLASAPARAQTVSDVLTFLVTNQSVATGSIDRDREAALATGDTISKALLANLATLPVTASSGAFVYRLNPELGTVERATQSFGPFFTERALTAGRHQASFGMTFQHLHFTSLDGRSLRDGSLTTTANQFTDEAAPFDVDQLTLNIDASVATLYGNIGVTDDVEIGFAAPFYPALHPGPRALERWRGQIISGFERGDTQHVRLLCRGPFLRGQRGATCFAIQRSIATHYRNWGSGHRVSARPAFQDLLGHLGIDHNSFLRLKFGSRNFLRGPHIAVWL